MKKKVGLITWNKSSNYGTCLQAFALFQHIELMGFECYMIRSFNHNELNSWGILKRIYRKVRKIVKRNNTKNDLPGRHPDKMKKIISFSINYFKYYPLVITPRDKQNLLKEIDFFLTGSDQIWNLYHQKNPFYMLDFVDDSTKKISYASSIGVSHINGKFEKIYSNYLSKFDSLAVREKQGSEILTKITGKNVETVLDPTFLLNESEWNEFIKDCTINEINFSKPYILCYFVGDNIKYWEGVDRIKKITCINNVIILPMEKSNYYGQGLIYEKAGPKEFVWLLKNSSIVCTDSFHATALSIIFKKNFIEFLRFKENDPKSQNSRIYEILKRYGLTEQIYNEKANNSFTPINYKKVYDILENDIKKSKKYLVKSLKIDE